MQRARRGAAQGDFALDGNLPPDSQPVQVFEFAAQGVGQQRPPCRCAEQGGGNGVGLADLAFAIGDQYGVLGGLQQSIPAGGGARVGSGIFGHGLVARRAGPGK